MYKIKQVPEDFIVKEINNIKLDNNGKYHYFLLKKKNYNTLRAIQVIAKKLNINGKNIGFAGNKDKNAITEQLISIENIKKIKNLKFKDVELKYLGKGNEKVFLGNLQGNEFIIAIRNLTKKEINNINNKIKENKIVMPNYFGPQRFSNKNHLIGKAIIKKNFKDAINLILKTNSDFNEHMKNHLEKNKNDFIGTLKIIPIKMLKFYVHSYQSYLFNKILDRYLKNDKIKNKIPIIGFGTEIENNNEIIKKILEKEKINLRDFIVRQIPGLSSEGDERNAFIKINDFKILNQEKDELNKNKEKLIVKFSLPKGSYATVLIDFLFR